MRILVFGAGAIGTYIGGSLALAGEDVAFLERKEVADQLSMSGLHLGLPNGEHSIARPRFFSSIDQAFAAGRYDLAILAVKGFDTSGVLEMIRPCLDRMPPVLCFQNGVENEPVLAAELGEERVIRGTVTTAIGRRGPGDITVERFRGTGIELNHPLSGHILAAGLRAGLGMRGYADGNAMKWSKMLTNLMGNATSAILNWLPARVYAHPDMFGLEVRQLNEVLSVMDALQIPVVDLPSTPVRMLASGIRYLPSFICRPLLVKAVGGGRGAKMPSFHIDLYHGRGQSEVDWLNGAVVRAARKAGLEAPVNAMLCDVLTKLTSGEWKKEDFADKPAKLLSMLS
ncbi:MAG: 2-dehydropantoate 2-reductase [Leptolinea sp.]|jgi:2-dehydropantoate 2-reductase|nr:2-dehydropantoate 2-reductase [Leptolinea sp.]